MNTMKIYDFLELFFIFTGTLSFPFIVMSSYFSFVKRTDNRLGTWEIIFLIVSIIYALLVTYFAWRNLINSENWKKISQGK